MKIWVMFWILLVGMTIVRGQAPDGVSYEYAYEDLDVIKNPDRTLTFLEGIEPVTGRVYQPLENFGYAIWEVADGRATRQTFYYHSGQMERRLEMKDGVEHGSFVMFFGDGKKYVEQFYENGIPVGTWRRWNREGELVETIVQDSRPGTEP